MKMTTTLMLALVATFAGCTAVQATNGTVNCLVAPCSTPACISKCAAFQTYNKNVTCVDNYIGGCNCDCCVAKNAICSVDRKDPPCCGGRICAFTNDCIVNPFTKCGTICTKPADAVENCKKEKSSCDPSKKTPCCKGLTCLKYGSGGRCSKCRGYTKSCSSSRPCCPYLKCKKNSYTGKQTCQPAGLP